MNNLVSVDQLLAQKSKKPVLVRAPEITGDFHSVVYVLNPTPDQADLAQMQWHIYQEEHLENPGGRVGFSKFLVAWSLCNQDNVPMLDPGDSETELNESFVDAIEKIGGETGLDQKLIKRIYDIAVQTFGLSKKDIEELEKNLEKTTSDDGSGSKPKPTGSDAENGSANSKASAKSKSSTRSKRSSRRDASAKNGTTPE